MKLHGYFRSSAAWRVRIALNLKGVNVEHVSHHLRHGEQRDPAYLALNPQGLVPTLELDDGTVLTQSLAIIEWLDETRPEPALLPKDPIERAKVRAFAQAIACDTHPVQNLKVLNRLRELGHDGAAALAWAVAEMKERYDKFAERKVRNLDGYNAGLSRGEKPMSRIVIIIDELADLMMVCKKDVEEYICRLTQLARAAGIHLIVATQRQIGRAHV